MEPSQPGRRPGVRLNICVFLACAFDFGSLVLAFDLGSQEP